VPATLKPSFIHLLVCCDRPYRGTLRYHLACDTAKLDLLGAHAWPPWRAAVATPCTTNISHLQPSTSSTEVTQAICLPWQGLDGISCLYHEAVKIRNKTHRLKRLPIMIVRILNEICTNLDLYFVLDGLYGDTSSECSVDLVEVTVQRTPQGSLAMPCPRIQP